MRFLFEVSGKHADYMKDIFASAVRDEGNEIMVADMDNLSIEFVAQAYNFKPDFIFCNSLTKFMADDKARMIYWDIDGLETLKLKNDKESMDSIKTFDFIFVGKPGLSPIYNKLGKIGWLLRPEIHIDLLLEEIKDMIHTLN